MESTLHPHLSLPEEILLLALHDEKGRPTGSSSYAHAIGGAIVSELLLAGRIRIVRPKKTHLVAVEQLTPLGDPLLDECLEKIATAKRRKSVSTWVGTFATTSRLKHRVAESLVAKGVLRKEEDEVLFVFTWKTYPTQNPEPERALLERIRRSVIDQNVPDARTLVVVSLAYGTGLLDQSLGKKEVKARKDWIKQMTSGDAVGQATKDAVQAAQAAMTMMITNM